MAGGSPAVSAYTTLKGQPGGCRPRIAPRRWQAVRATARTSSSLRCCRWAERAVFESGSHEEGAFHGEISAHHRLPQNWRIPGGRGNLRVMGFAIACGSARRSGRSCVWYRRRGDQRLLGLVVTWPQSAVSSRRSRPLAAIKIAQLAHQAGALLDQGGSPARRQPAAAAALISTSPPLATGSRFASGYQVDSLEGLAAVIDWPG